MDVAEVFPSWVLLQYRVFFGSVDSGGELLRYLVEIVELRILSFWRGDL